MIFIEVELLPVIVFRQANFITLVFITKKNVTSWLKKSCIVVIIILCWIFLFAFLYDLFKEVFDDNSSIIFFCFLWQTKYSVFFIFFCTCACVMHAFQAKITFLQPLVIA
jgi:hypothetical protein